MTDNTNSISFEDSDAVKALDCYFQQKSTMEILGVDRDENAHSFFSGTQERRIPVYVCQTSWDGPAMMIRFILYLKTIDVFTDSKIQEVPTFLQERKNNKKQNSNENI